MLSADTGVRFTERMIVFTPRVWNKRPLFMSTLKSLKEEQDDEHIREKCIHFSYSAPFRWVPLALFTVFFSVLKDCTVFVRL